MKEYDVWIHESFWKRVQIKAENRDEAAEIAYNMVLEGINWVEEAEDGEVSLDIEEIDE